eukprot:jgi/Botrbrau1/16199/Bobra.354_1s0006.1
MDGWLLLCCPKHVTNLRKPKLCLELQSRGGPLICSGWILSGKRQTDLKANA